MKVRARINNYRSSARKARLIAPAIKGLSAMEAQVQLEQLRKGCADDVRKLIVSAVANAENNHGLDKEKLFVSEYIVEEGRTMKRWRPRAHGRAAQILKRTCDIEVVLEDKVEKDSEDHVNDKIEQQKAGGEKSDNTPKEDVKLEEKAKKDNSKAKE